MQSNPEMNSNFHIRTVIFLLIPRRTGIPLHCNLANASSIIN